MKLTGKITILIILTFLSCPKAQTVAHGVIRKGKFYFYWGWNRAWYSNSDINFRGKDYNFNIKNVAAADRQTSFSIDKYLNPANATIPQYNFRVGYFITDNYSISFGIDHMKYVVRENQFVKITGHINNTGTVYDRSYSEENIQLKKGFLLFEHTNGLNYINFDVRRIDEVFNFNKVKINVTGGLGAGILLPKTNTTFINYKRYDEFHLSGYGINGMVGINISFFDSFFIQSEFKGGYINMPDIRTTIAETDRASQNFFFYQLNVVFGTVFKF